MKRRVARVNGERILRRQDAVTASEPELAPPPAPVELEELPVVVAIGPQTDTALGRSSTLPPWDRGEMPPLPVYPGVVPHPKRERWEE